MVSRAQKEIGALRQRELDLRRAFHAAHIPFMPAWPVLNALDDYPRVCFKPIVDFDTQLPVIDRASFEHLVLSLADRLHNEAYLQAYARWGVDIAELEVPVDTYLPALSVQPMSSVADSRADEAQLLFQIIELNCECDILTV